MVWTGQAGDAVHHRDARDSSSQRELMAAATESEQPFYRKMPRGFASILAREPSNESGQHRFWSDAARDARNSWPVTHLQIIRKTAIDSITLSSPFSRRVHSLFSRRSVKSASGLAG